MLKLLPLICCDGYKLEHRKQYPESTEIIYSTWTPRFSKKEGFDDVVVFGIQYAIKKVHDYFDEYFFKKNIDDILKEYASIMECYGVYEIETDHIRNLHKIGFLPIKISSVYEGAVVKFKTPVVTIENTLDEFFWITNFLETFLSCELWPASTAATIALKYKKILKKYAKKTSSCEGFVDIQAHDFSMRGLEGIEATIGIGLGHLSSFKGTDTITAIQGAMYYYNQKGFIAGTVPATEHSIQSSYGDDLKYFKKMLDIYKKGIVSIVSDGYDYFNVLTNVLPKIRKEILSRDGKVVIRPDSGDPVKIICGDKDGKTIEEQKGSIEILYEIFGGFINEKGYKELDPHIGLIYGDSITLNRCEEICQKLAEKGFASTNVVFGVGSYSYQYNTRDSFGFALKSTANSVSGKEFALFKDPKTDDGMKKSQKGRVFVDADFSWSDGYTSKNMPENNMLKPIYIDGKFLIETSLEDVRKRLDKIA
jgi:nicotinamide phosphoribosyltransferase